MKDKGWVGADGKRYYITEDEYQKAIEEDLAFKPSKIPLTAPHFVFYTKKIVSDMFGEDIVEQGGLKITTTLDLDMHKKAQEIVYEKVEDSADMNVWNGSMVVLDPKNGQILAMVGSKGYNLDPQPDGCVSGIAGDDGCKFDPYVNVTTSLRQPGSAIKPITYATMLSQGYSPAFPLLDVPTLFEGAAPDKPYDPENYDGVFRGVMSVRKSLGNSLNIPAVKALKIAGIDNMIDQAEKMGISSFTERERYGLALTLGGGEVRLLELTGAFSVFAAKGMYKQPTPILEIRDSNDNILYKHQDTGGTRALSEEVAFLISDILSDNGARSSAFGTGSLLNVPGYQVSVKTGTTDDKRDNYAIGFTPSIVVGAWVGNNNNEKMNQYVASGITGATPIWRSFMNEYLKDKENEKLEAPENVKKIEIDELTGMLPYGDSEKRSEWFIEGTEPTAPSDWYQRIRVCEDDGRIANESCDKHGDTDDRTFIKIKAALPEWQYATDSWVKENYDDDKYFPPMMTSKLEYSNGGDVENKDEVHTKIVGVSDGDTVPLFFRLNVEVSAYEDVERVNIYMDGDKIGDDRSEPYGYNFELSVSDIGEHTFEVVARDEDGNKGSDEVKLDVSGYARYD
jgi:membrane peptidoglycan carboxypeptidase